MPARPRATLTAEPAVRRPGSDVVDVTAVLVSHDGAAWLPEALHALAVQTVRPARVVFVDTGSSDGSRELLAAAAARAGEPVVDLPRDTGYGAAIAAGLERAGAPTRWVWLLHDDAAPDAGALEALLGHADDSPSAALLGPKALDWHDPRLLVEVGLTTDAAGHRATGLERREYDQGQHDAPRDVLAVGTAGALVRRDVWDALGGLDPALPVFRDDLDLGWRVNAAGHRVVVVPAAQVLHVRAATTGHRTPGAFRGRPAGVDRRHALFVLLAHAPRRGLALAVPRLVLACLLRALGFLLTRQVLLARDELAALAAVLGRPRRLLAARRARARTRAVPDRALRPLFASGVARLRARVETLAGWIAGTAPRGNGPRRALGDPGPEGPDELSSSAPGSGGLRHALRRPGVVLVLALSLIALVAERSVLSVGGGVLAGGRLLPVPAGGSELWAAYGASWHPSSVGSSAPAPPQLLVLAVLSTVLLGKVWLAVDVLLLASVPIAGAVAYLVAGRLVRSLVLRVWAAVTWALLPVATGAVAAGRLDAAAVQVALPLLLLAGCAVLRRDPRHAGWRGAWALGLGLAATVALAPTLWPVAAVLLALGGVVVVLTRSAPAQRAAARRQLLAGLVAAAVPALVLLPWSLHALRSPGVLLHGPGRLGPELVASDLPAWNLLLLSPGGPGTPVLWASVGFVLAALAGLVRAARRQLALAAWTVALVGLAAALVLARTSVAVPGTTTSLPLWPGVPLQVAAAGMLAAALVAADGARTRLMRASFGWRQPVSVAVALAAALTPLLLGGAWLVRGADDPLRRDVQPLLPAFARAEIAAAPGLRVLALAPRPDGTVAYELTGPDGSQLGVTGTPPEAAQARALDTVVADLLSPRGSAAAQALATRAVRYVALPAGPSAGPIADVLDQQPGLTRRSEEDVLLWRLAAPAARLTLLAPATAGAAVAGEPGPPAAGPAPTALAGTDRTVIPAGPAGRLLVLAEAADDDWVATVDGRPLERRTAWGWAQGFVLPAEGGSVVVGRDRAGRERALIAQAGAVLLVAILAAPSAHRRRGLEVQDREAEPSWITSASATGTRAAASGGTGAGGTGTGGTGARGADARDERPAGTDPSPPAQRAQPGRRGAGRGRHAAPPGASASV